MIYYWSQAEESFRGTLVHTAERRDNRRIGALHGFNYVTETSEKAHRSALWELAYSRRGTKATMARAVECAFSDGNYSTYLIVSALYDDKLFTSATLDPAVWVQRYIRTPWGVHLVTRVQNGQNVSGVGNGYTVLTLSRTTNVYYSALPHFAGVVQNETLYEKAYITAWLLPFVIQEKTPSPHESTGRYYHPGDPCAVDILLFNDWREMPPAAYLRDDGDSPEGDATPGGHLLEDVNVIDAPSGGDGGYPVYLGDGSTFPQLTKQLSRMLPPGSTLTIKLIRRTG